MNCPDTSQPHPEHASFGTGRKISRPDFPREFIGLIIVPGGIEGEARPRANAEIGRDIKLLLDTVPNASIAATRCRPRVRFGVGDPARVVEIDGARCVCCWRGGLELFATGGGSGGIAFNGCCCEGRYIDAGQGRFGCEDHGCERHDDAAAGDGCCCCYC